MLMVPSIVGRVAGNPAVIHLDELSQTTEVARDTRG